MMIWHASFSYDFVVMLGDNIYGRKSAADFRRKFEDPYGPLLALGVQFYASLGNHDHTNERFYKPFNMDGKRYYTFRRGDVEFFVLDSNYMDPTQWTGLNNNCRLHCPLEDLLFSPPTLLGWKNARDLDLRRQLEPIFVEYGVDVVLSGHEHFYERLQPQKEIYYFVLGNSGELRYHDLKSSFMTLKGFDTDRAFALMEISGDELHFQTISRTGETVDSGVLPLKHKRGS